MILILKKAKLLVRYCANNYRVATLYLLDLIVTGIILEGLKLIEPTHEHKLNVEKLYFELKYSGFNQLILSHFYIY